MLALACALKDATVLVVLSDGVVLGIVGLPLVGNRLPAVSRQRTVPCLVSCSLSGAYIKFANIKNIL